jgi:GMP synthase (glutamine-hydrolysing)
MKKIWIIRHVDYERLGHIPDILEELQLPYATISLSKGEPLPPLEEVAGVITMGGPMSAYDKASYDWIEKEERFVRAVHAHGIPLFAICLGAQILAQALGAKVQKAPAVEVGWHLLKRVLQEEDGLLRGLQIPPLFQYHYDMFDLPDGAVNLLQSDHIPHQMFRLGRTTYGVQFHAEANEAMLQGVAKEYAHKLPKEAARDMVQNIEMRSAAGRQFLYEIFKRLFGKSCDKIGS